MPEPPVPGARLQLLGLPDDGLPPHHGAARAVRARHWPRCASQLPLRDRSRRASVLPPLRGEELLSAALAPRRVERQRQLPRCSRSSWPSSSSTDGIGRAAKANLDAQELAPLRQRHAPPAAPDRRPLRDPVQLALASGTCRACRRARRSRPTAMASARARPSEALLDAAAATSSCRPGPRPRRSAICRQSASLVVLHGVGPDDAEAALQLTARPCLNTRRTGRAVEGDRARAAPAT